MRTIIACAFICTAGAWLTYFGTDGFHAFTAEQARRYSALNNPVKVEPVTLTTHLGDEIEYFSNRNQYVVVEFIFTHCPTVCQALGRSFNQLQDRLEDENLNGIQLLSITFDLEVDGQTELAHFADRHGADDSIWLVARPQSEKQLGRLLKRFGIVVLNDPFYRFVHNGGLHIVSPDGRLVAIFDPEDVDGALEFLKTRA